MLTRCPGRESVGSRPQPPALAPSAAWCGSFCSESSWPVWSAVLQLNVRLDELGRERIQLRADNARLSSQLSSAAAAARIEAQARQRLGLVPADANTTAYVQLAPTPR